MRQGRLAVIESSLHCRRGAHVVRRGGVQNLTVPLPPLSQWAESALDPQKLEIGSAGIGQVATQAGASASTEPRTSGQHKDLANP